jgi:hypothetical protein
MVGYAVGKCRTIVLTAEQRKTGCGRRSGHGQEVRRSGGRDDIIVWGEVHHYGYTTVTTPQATTASADVGGVLSSLAIGHDSNEYTNASMLYTGKLSEWLRLPGNCWLRVDEPQSFRFQCC